MADRGRIEQSLGAAHLRVRRRNRAAGGVARFCVASAMLLASCRAGGEPPLRVGIPAWAPAECARIGRELGLFDDGHVEIVQYGSPIELARHFREGSLDGAALTLDFVPYLAQSIPSLDVVFVINVSDGADGVVATREIAELRDLRGKRIGVESSPLGAHMLLRALRAGGLFQKDVVPVSVDTEDQVEAFRDGRIDAVVTYEPDRTKLIASGATSLFDSSQVPGQIVDVLVLPTSVAAARADMLRRLLNGWVAAFARLREDRPAVLSRLAASLAVDVPTIDRALAGVKLGDLAINRDLLSGSSPRLAATLQEIESLAVSAGLLRSELRRGIRFTDAYLPTVVPRTTGRLTAAASP
jgi:NitT/TauT family transport system substrate-binding protein